MSEVPSEAKKQAAAEFNQKAEVIDIPLQRREGKGFEFKGIENSVLQRAQSKRNRDKGVSTTNMDEASIHEFSKANLLYDYARKGNVDTDLATHLDEAYTERIEETRKELDDTVIKLLKQEQILREVEEEAKDETDEMAEQKIDAALNFSADLQRDITTLERNIDILRKKRKVSQAEKMNDRKRALEINLRKQKEIIGDDPHSPEGRIIQIVELKQEAIDSLPKEQQKFDTLQQNKERLSGLLERLTQESKEYRKHIRIKPLEERASNEVELIDKRSQQEAIQSDLEKLSAFIEAGIQPDAEVLERIAAGEESAETLAAELGILQEVQEFTEGRSDIENLSIGARLRVESMRDSGDIQPDRIAMFDMNKLREEAGQEAQNTGTEAQTKHKPSFWKRFFNRKAS
ncbi:MAG: hypothetical protein ABII02_00695 [Candidatus Magasanikbacteria bacterium]